MKSRVSVSVCGALAVVWMSVQAGAAPVLPIVQNVEWQPLAAQVRRVMETMDALGSPVSDKTKKQIEEALAMSDTTTAKVRLQQLLDPYCLFGVHINPEMRVKVSQGPAKPELDEQGWRSFLVKVANESGTTAALQAVSPNARSTFESGSSDTPSDKFFKRAEPKAAPADAADLWLSLATFDRQPLTPRLTGLDVEYRVVQLYSRDAGKREARIGFNVGQGTQDIGYRNEVDVLFTCLPASEVSLRVRDEKDQPTTASFLIRDKQGRVYPSQAKRLAPDFAFHPQIYREDGETLKLPAGAYTVEFSRGPESVAQKRSLVVKGKKQTETFQVKRWIDPSELGWWSGDHHIHAAGCAHYVKPTEGVHAEDMIRHVKGEDLKVGANLTWGPCFDYQKQFFCGEIDKVSEYPYLLRYDIEVSGFGSHESGHLVLLRLKDQMYPGGDSKHHWPKLGLNTLRWAKKQGAVVGPAHSGWGLDVKTDALPNYEIPPYSGIGANEYVMDVTHLVPGPDGQKVPAVDFISTVDTPYVWELNMWYHTLNVGFPTRISGETDFPCIYGERVGLGRSYVNLGAKVDYDKWCEGIRQGRCYVSDGKSHLIDFKVNGAELGVDGSELRLKEAETVRVTCQVAARLEEEPDPALQKRSYAQKPYWDVERARIGDTRKVPVEVIVNGYPAGRKELVADGRLQTVEFDVPIKYSSWVAMRILPSSHTNPIFVLVDGKPIRASKRSAEWCLKGVDRCWSEKEKYIRQSKIDGELKQAEADYAHAREVYQERLKECVVD